MKTIICRSVEYIPSIHVESVSGTNITLKSGRSFSKLKTETAEYSMDKVNGDGGNYVNNNISVSFLEDKEAEKVFYQYNIVFRVTGSDGNLYIIGSPQYPAKSSSINKNTNETRASFTAKSLQLFDS